ncbi:MAG TPA: 2-oxoacid:ferredoxin oxidoreductase subunit beta [Vicinamibacteria bacterium]|nr:2-oxoacid:ferredoxin oxidoreductase subunit beta [Vicinamibacteria bacterium]
MATAELALKGLESDVHPDWCPGCGDFGVLKSLKEAILELGIAPHDILVVSGIGCSSNLPGFLRTYGVHSLHGRALPVATGAALANHALHVVAVGGDGDGYGIGMAHFIHAMRRNLNLTYIVMDNEIYGLTTGQASPTTMEGHKTKSTPRGNVERPINPVALALTAGASYVARGFSGEQKHLTKLVAGAIAHRGFALVDVFSPCVTFNKLNTYPWFKERVYKVEESDGYNPTDFMGALEKAFEFGVRIPIGLLFEAQRPTYEDTEPVLSRGPLVEQPLGVDRATFAEILAETT